MRGSECVTYFPELTITFKWVSEIRCFVCPLRIQSFKFVPYGRSYGEPVPSCHWHYRSGLFCVQIRWLCKKKRRGKILDVDGCYTGARRHKIIRYSMRIGMQKCCSQITAFHLFHLCELILSKNTSINLSIPSLHAPYSNIYAEKKRIQKTQFTFMESLYAIIAVL